MTTTEPPTFGETSSTEDPANTPEDDTTRTEEQTSSADEPTSDGDLQLNPEEQFEKPKVTEADVVAVMEDPRFDLPNYTITTAEDAYQAYLREEIDETELRAVVSKYGGSPFFSLKNRLERPDNAFVRQVPDDLYDDPSLAVSPVEDRLKVVRERQDAAHKATEEAEEDK